MLGNVKALKNTCIFIYQDFCKYTIEVRKKHWTLTGFKLSEARQNVLSQLQEHCCLRQPKISLFDITFFK